MGKTNKVVTLAGEMRKIASECDTKKKKSQEADKWQKYHREIRRVGKYIKKVIEDVSYQGTKTYNYKFDLDTPVEVVNGVMHDLEEDGFEVKITPGVESESGRYYILIDWSEGK